MDKMMLKSYIHEWADRIRVHPKEIHIKAMKRKWASCSSKGRISVNIDLMAQDKVLVDEVIVHELLHLKFPKHNKLFHALIKSYLAHPLLYP